VIDFNQSGDGTYGAAPQLEQSIPIAAASQTISPSTPPAGATVGGTTYTASATASSGLTVAITLDASSTGCSLSAGGVVSFPHVGTCVIDFNQAGDGTYGAAAQLRQSIPIAIGSQTINPSSAPVTAMVGGTTYTPTATATSGLTVVITLDGSSTGCALSAGVVSFTSPGTCLVDFNQAGDGDYNAAPLVQQSIAVSLVSQSITPSSPPPGAIVGGPTYTATATASSGLAVAITLDSTSTGCSLGGGGVVSFPHHGTCVIDFNQAGDGTYAAAPRLQQSIPIAIGTQTIDPSTPPSGATVGGSTYTPTATATSGLPVAITLDASSAGCSLSTGGVVSYTSAGTCLVDFNQSGDSDYAAAPRVQQSIPVALQSQTISPSTPPAGATVAGSTYTPSATATSGLTVAITLDASSSGCSLSGGGVVSFPHHGTCVIDFNQAGDGTYAAATQRQQSIPIVAASQTITPSTAPAAATVGVTTYTPTATATSGLPVAITLDPSSSNCSLSAGTISFTAAGTCVVDFNQSGNGDYDAAPQKQQSIPVTLQSQTIDPSTPPAGATIGGSTYTPTATATSGLAVAITLDASSSGCSLSAGVVAFPHAGTCEIDFNQAGNGTYAPAPQRQQTIAIAKASQTISPSTPPASATVAGATYTPSATASSGLTVAITLGAASSGCSLSAGGVVSFTASGTCVIDFNQAGNGDYNAAGQAQQSIPVALQAQTISPSTPPASETVGAGATYAPTASATSGLAVAITLDAASSGCSLSGGGVVSFPHTGTCLIDFDQAGNATYSAAPQLQQSIVIAAGSQTITPSTPPADATVGGATYTPTATSTSALAVAITLDPSSSGCSLSSGTISFTADGTCVIDFNQAGDADYNPAPQRQQSITIGLAAQSITVTSTAPGGAVVAGPSYTPAATSTSGLAVAITLDAASAGCSLSDGVVSFTAVGTCVIDFNEAGNTSYAPATQRQQSIAVALQQQTITPSTAPASAAVGGPVYSPTAVASSGLAVAITLDASSTGCSLSAGVVSFTSAGSCLVDFSQAGNSTYAPAPEVVQAIPVDLYSQTIDVTSAAPSNAIVGGATYMPAATASSGLTVAITLDLASTGCSLNDGVVSFTAAGSCLIDFNQAGDGTYDNAPERQQGVAVGPGSQSITFTSAPPSDATVGGDSYAPTATASSGLAVSISLDASSSGCSLGFGVVSFTAIGTCVIDANQPGDADYNAAPQARQSIAVAPPPVLTPPPSQPAGSSQSTNPPPATTTLAAPVLASTADLTPVSGTVLIRLPGATSFTPLTNAINIPLGSTINATNGTVSLTVALPDGATETGQFYGGEFVLTQSKNGMLIATLSGGSFAGCPAAPKKGAALIAAAKKKKTTVIRQLWGNAHGDYTTKGRYGSAAVSGTIWLTQDRCDGTYVRVTKDNVIVVAYAHPKTRHNVRQGHHILIPAPGY
jgi:hypothetical protein